MTGGGLGDDISGYGDRQGRKIAQDAGRENSRYDCAHRSPRMFGMNFWCYVHTFRLDRGREKFFPAWAAVLWGAVMFFPAASQADPALGVQSIIESTTTEWSQAFSAHGRLYRAPRLLLTRHPRYHPERAAGYYRGLAVAIDLGEIEDIGALFPRDSETLTALVVAHEVAHHVQFLNVQEGGVAASPDPAYELQADCAAGWWLGRANVRDLATTGATRFSIQDIERQLPRLFQALYTLQYRRLDAPSPKIAARHGADGERIAAFQRGLNTADPARCGVSVAP